MTDQDKDTTIVKQHLAALSEHWDTVQILCTRTEGKNTVNMCIGSGNFFARYGHAKAWLANEERAESMLNTPPEDTLL